MYGDLVLGIAASAAVVLLCLDLFGLLDYQYIKDNLDKFTTLLIALYIVSAVIERRLLLVRHQNNVLLEIQKASRGPYRGFSAIYACREHMPTFSDMIQSARKELYIAGIDLAFVVLQQLTTLQAKAEAGCCIKLLLVDAGDAAAPNPILDSLGETLDYHRPLKDVLQANIDKLCQWKSKLPKAVQKRIEIKLSMAIPTHIAVFLDKDQLSGRMYLEMLPPKTDAQQRWSLVVDSHQCREVYPVYLQAYKALWAAARFC